MLITQQYFNKVWNRLLTKSLNWNIILLTARSKLQKIKQTGEKDTFTKNQTPNKKGDNELNRKLLGQKLRSYRAKRGWSIAECAEHIGISPRYLADIERGDKVPKLETFIHMLNILTASADDVLQDSLSMGYTIQSHDRMKWLDSLDSTQRKQTLEILDSVITALSKK